MMLLSQFIAVSLLGQNGSDDGGGIPSHLWVFLALVALSSVSGWVKKRAEKQRQEKQQEKRQREQSQREVEQAQRPADKVAKPAPLPANVRRLPTYARGRLGQQQAGTSARQPAPPVQPTGSAGPRPSVRPAPPIRPPVVTRPTGAAAPRAKKSPQRATTTRPTVVRQPVSARPQAQRVPQGQTSKFKKPPIVEAMAKQKMRAAVELRRKKYAMQNRDVKATVMAQTGPGGQTLVNVGSPEALARAVISMEILGQPLALRESGPGMG